MAEEIKNQYLDATGLEEAYGYIQEDLDKKVDKVQGKQLSTEDFTKEYKDKLDKLDEEQFSGDYEDLENLPTFNGTEWKGTLTDAGLGIALKSEAPTAATTDKAGLVKPDGTTIKAAADGTITAQLGDYAKTSEVDKKLEDYTKTDGLEDAIEDFVDGKISESETSMQSYADGKASEAQQAAQTYSDGKLAAARTEISAEIDGDVAAVKSELENKFKGGLIYKGKVANIAGLPAISEAQTGWMYSVITGGTTTADFEEGAGKKLADGANVALTDGGKWDMLPGDVSGFLSTEDAEKTYVKQADYVENEPIPSSKIKSIFGKA